MIAVDPIDLRSRRREIENELAAEAVERGIRIGALIASAVAEREGARPRLEVAA